MDTFPPQGLSALASSIPPPPIHPLASSYSHVVDHTTFVDVAAGESHCVALTKGGTLFSWGTGRSGQLGLGDTRAADQPMLVDALVTVRARITSVSCGSHHTLAGEFWCGLF